MKKLIILFIALLFTSCATNHTFKPVCRHYALLQAQVVGEYYPVRIIVGETKDGGLHAQAQAKIAGKWQWLNSDRAWVYVGNTNRLVKIIRYFSLKDYEEHMQIIRLIQFKVNTSSKKKSK